MPAPPRPNKLSPRNDKKKQLMAKRRAMAKEAKLYQKKRGRCTKQTRHSTLSISKTITPACSIYSYRAQSITSYSTPPLTPVSRKSNPKSCPRSEFHYSDNNTMARFQTPTKQNLDTASQYSGGSEMRQQRMMERIQWDSD